MKILLSILLLSLISVQVLAQKLQLGFGVSSNIGVNFEDYNKYRVDSESLDHKNPITAINLFLKIKTLNNFNVYPNLNFTVTSNSFLIHNSNGLYRPEGSSVSIPYKAVYEGWEDHLYSNDYEHYLSTGKVKQTNAGFYFTRSFTEKFEFGFGVVLKIKKCTVENFKAKDKYVWSSSTGTKYDNYDYLETIRGNASTKEIYKVYKPSLPLVVKYNQNIGKINTSFSLVAHLGADTYISGGIAFLLLN